MNLTESLRWHERARKVLTCNGAQTLSKAAERSPGTYPIYLKRGSGSHVWDVDGQEYIDYVCGLGPLILGHNYPRVTEAIKRQADDGCLFSLEHPLTVEVAEILCDMAPCAEAVRFVKTGSDANEAAVRLARAYTGRDVILSCGYHGWDNTFQILELGRGETGVPWELEYTSISFQFNRWDQLEVAFDGHRKGSIAAVVIEPMRFEPPAPGFLEKARELCDKHGAVLIFDEVVTSFRWARGGAQEYFGVIPDLACLGKAVANGMPLGAVVGKREIMDAFDRCFVSGTYAGETLSLAAAKATLETIRDEPVIEHIWRQGERLRDAFNALARHYHLDAVSRGYGPCTCQTFNGPDANLLKSLWLQETVRHGVLFGGIQYIGYSHSDEDIAHSITAIEHAFAFLDEERGMNNLSGALRGRPIALDTFAPGGRQ